MKRREFISQSLGAAAFTTTLPIADLYAQVKTAARKTENTKQIFDVIVIGVGSMGSSTCYHLAKQGLQVLGLEQFDIPHELGSHAGQSRIIRKAYFEHPDYVPLLERAYQNWKILEEETDSQLYFKTGLLYFGKSDHALIKGLRESAQKYSIEVNELSHQEVKSNYPQFQIPAEYDRLVEPDAGFITPERAVLLYTQQAILMGAAIHTKESVLSWKKIGDSITVTTTKGTYSCKKMVITAGPWSSQLIPTLSAQLKVTRQLAAWVIPKNWKQFEYGNFPCWTIADELKGGIFYGFPILTADKFNGPIGLKLAHHFHGETSNPDFLDRNPTKSDETNLVYALNKFIPDGYKTIHVMKTCMYTNTPDENFVLDFHPNTDQSVAIATGFSGHGFKFAAVVGEIMSDLVIQGSTKLPIGFLSSSRFH